MDNPLQGTPSAPLEIDKASGLPALPGVEGLGQPAKTSVETAREAADDGRQVEVPPFLVVTR